MNDFEFYSPTRFVFGRGVTDAVGQHVAELGYKRALLVYGGGSVVRTGTLARVKKSLVKAGVEFVDGKFNLSTVVTHGTSDWSIIPQDGAVPFVWIKVVWRLDAVEIFYSFDDKEYVMMRNAWLQDNTPVMVGLMAASPDGEGFEAKFENFSVKHLPDMRRMEWLKRNAE